MKNDKCNPKILIADDDEDNRAIVRMALTQIPIDIVEATNGQQAFELAQKEIPDIILLDMSMPKLSGWDVAKQLRSLPQTRCIYIIAFTAHALIGDNLKSKSAGCDDYVSKPCIPSDIANRVKSWVEKNRNK